GDAGCRGRAPNEEHDSPAQWGNGMMCIMGEVRAKVQLYNYVDEAQVSDGKRKADEIRKYEADALVDSGAIRTVIPGHVFDALGLKSSVTAVAEYADGRKDTVPLAYGLRVEIMGRA